MRIIMKLYVENVVEIIRWCLRKIYMKGSFKMIISELKEAYSYNTDDIIIDEGWNTGEEKELKIHSVHAYPAKFPAFISTKAINYAKKSGLNVRKVADIFCGCGTVALEAKYNNIDFWGCDINPVATLIATVKSSDYNKEKIQTIYKKIIKDAGDISSISHLDYEKANERLKYWFSERQYLDLLRFYIAINQISNHKYKKLFMCIFSSCLKSTSRWLTKSIKPQIDPNKIEIPVEKVFKQQYKKFETAFDEIATSSKADIKIETANFLNKRKLPKVDLIVTSPPYVTSYEYADLHQLSSLWLGYADDFRKLRNGTIGSIYNSEDYYFEVMDLNVTAKKIITQLREQEHFSNAKIKSVARYYIDMQKTAKKCYDMLDENGFAFFILGDTEYKTVKIENSRHLIESLLVAGFNDVSITKRKITNKLLTPYRDNVGRFSSDKNSRAIYHEEFVIIGRKSNEREKN